MGKILPKFLHLLTVRAEGADPPSPPYGQLDRKKTVFLRLPLPWGWIDVGCRGRRCQVGAVRLPGRGL